MSKINGDSLSYELHNKQYEDEDSYSKEKAAYDKLLADNFFKLGGFKKVIADECSGIERHVDFGSGTGWLLRETSPFFKEVLGLEPSLAAIKMAKEFNQDFTNIAYENIDMGNWLSANALDSRSFYTSSVVFSHIADQTTLEILSFLAKAAEGSVLYFYEPYGKNRQQFAWKVRSVEWWAKALPDWELSFLDYETAGYKAGILGKYLGRTKVVNRYELSAMEKLLWLFSGIPSRLKLLAKSIYRFFSK